MDADRYRIGAGKAAGLGERDPSDQSLFEGDKKAGKAALRELNKRLEELQELFYADNRHRLLVVLQATDTGGKDGTIRHVFRGVNPQGVRVHSFGVPSETELAHDYLWRIHAHVPPDGYIGVFNRSAVAVLGAAAVGSAFQSGAAPEAARSLVGGIPLVSLCSALALHLLAHVLVGLLEPED